MKRLTLLFLLLSLGTLSYGQGGGYNSAAVQSFAGFKNPVVTVCSAQATSCSASQAATIFTDNTLTQSSQNPFQGDTNGNFHFFAAPGWYQVQVCPTAGSANCLSYLALVAPDANNTAVMSIGIIQSTTSLPAQSGNYRLAAPDSICFRNAANNADVCLSKNSSDQIVGAAASSPLISSSTNPAQTGVVRAAANDTLCFRNAANTNDVCLSKNGSDQIVGASASTPLISSTANPAATGVVRIAASDQICFRNQANTADVCLSKNGSDQIVGASASSPLISASANPAATGIVRVSSSDLGLCFRNAGNTADVCLSKNSNDQMINVLNIGTLSMAVASCIGSTPSANVDLPTSGAPAAACTGSNETFGYLSFPAGSVSTFYTHVQLPATWSGNIDVAFQWFTSATANSTTWQIQTGCATAGTTVMTTGPALNTANTVTTSDNATANTMTQSVINAITTTGCSAGQDMFIAVSRSGTDSNTAAAGLIDLVLTIRKVTQ